MKHAVKNQVNYNCHIFLCPCPVNSIHRKLILNDTDESSCTCDIKASRKRLYQKIYKQFWGLISIKHHRHPKIDSKFSDCPRKSVGF